jgi:hypothetical protein
MDMTLQNKTKNNTYRVLICIQPPFIIEKDGEYSGLILDEWKKVKEYLPEYKFEETYVKTKNHDEFVKKIVDENYDLGIGCIGTTSDRIKKVYYTKTIFISQCIIMYKDKHMFIKTIIKFFFIYFLPFFIAILLVSVILGYFIASKTHEKTTFYRTIALTAGALFGSKGSLLQNVALNTKNVFILIIILLISTFGLQLLQGLVVNILARAYNESEITRDNVSRARLMGIKGSNVPKIFESIYNCKIKYFDGDIENAIQEYLKNPSEVDGICCNSAEALFLANKYNLNITKQSFSLNDHAWVVNFKNTDLLQNLNVSIAKLTDSDFISKLCREYLKPDDAYMCSF